MRVVPTWLTAVFTVVTVTPNVRGADEPYALFAVTEMVPLMPAVAIMLLVVLVPLQPDGNVHV